MIVGLGSVQPYSFALSKGIDMSSERPDSPCFSPPVDIHTHTPSVDMELSLPVLPHRLYLYLPPSSASFCPAFKRPFFTNNRQGGKWVVVSGDGRGRIHIREGRKTGGRERPVRFDKTANVGASGRTRHIRT